MHIPNTAVGTKNAERRPVLLLLLLRLHVRASVNTYYQTPERGCKFVRVNQHATCLLATRQHQPIIRT